MKANSTRIAAGQAPRKAWRRRVLGTLARLLERAVPAAPPHGQECGLPPEIRFPLF